MASRPASRAPERAPAPLSTPIGSTVVAHLRAVPSPAPSPAPSTAAAAIDWLAGTPAGAANDLLRDAAPVSVEPYSEFCAFGSAPDRFFVLVTGRAGAWRPPDAGQSADGMWCHLSQLPYTSFGLENAVGGIAYFSSLRTLNERAELLEIPTASLQRLLQVHPPTGVDIARHLARRLRGATEQGAEAAMLDAGQRVAKYLLRLAGSDDVTVYLTQNDLAARLGLSRQSVNLPLSRFRSRGWLVRVARGQYRIDDREALVRYAGDYESLGVTGLH